MALTPIDEVHALQIQAGTLGRKAGHEFEDRICQEINALTYPLEVDISGPPHVFTGDPALLLLSYVARHSRFPIIHHASAISTGSLATSEEGRRWLSINGSSVSRCKSDVVLSTSAGPQSVMTWGVSTKQCNNSSPTNAQLFFTTARGFANLLRGEGISVSDEAVIALRQFCGDTGFRPLDDKTVLKGRMVDPRRYFWEEIGAAGRAEWELLFNTYQDRVTRLLLQKAYVDDPFVPDFLLHKTKAAASWSTTEVAIFAIEELILLSQKYQGFCTKAYSVRKGSFRDPPEMLHLAPRFGVVQMQRGGQKQHPEQLQFNLEAGYFYRL